MYQLCVSVGNEYTPWGKVSVNLYPDGSCVVHKMVFEQETVYNTMVNPDEVKAITDALTEVKQTEIDNNFEGALPDEALYEFILVGKITQVSILLSVFQSQASKLPPFVWIIPQLKTIVQNATNGNVVF